jgi:hypothetical protein
LVKRLGELFSEPVSLISLYHPVSLRAEISSNPELGWSIAFGISSALTVKKEQQTIIVAQKMA